MSTIFPLTLNAWAPIATNDAHVLQSGGIGKVVYQVSDTEPAPYDDDQPVYNVTTNKTSFEYRNSQEGLTLWAWLTEGKAQVSVTPLLNSGIPDGAYKGFRAQNVQFYDESNKKLGAQWEASRRVTGVANNAFLYSVLRIGSTYPIDLKSRTLGATGAGVIGRIYELYPEDILSFGTPDPWYNMRFDKADPAIYQPDTEIYPEPQVTFVGGQTASSFAIPSRKRGADLFEETNEQNQSKGFTAREAGSNRIFYQNSIALLEIQSLDVQNINARLEMFEGFLDLPLP